MRPTLGRLGGVGLKINLYYSPLAMRSFSVVKCLAICTQTFHDQWKYRRTLFSRAIAICTHTALIQKLKVRRVGTVKPAFPRRSKRRQKLIGLLFLARLIASCRIKYERLVERSFRRAAVLDRFKLHPHRQNDLFSLKRVASGWYGDSTPLRNLASSPCSKCTSRH